MLHSNANGEIGLPKTWRASLYHYVFLSKVIQAAALNLPVTSVSTVPSSLIIESLLSNLKLNHISMSQCTSTFNVMHVHASSKHCIIIKLCSNASPTQVASSLAVPLHALGRNQTLGPFPPALQELLTGMHGCGCVAVGASLWVRSPFLQRSRSY